VRVFGLHRRAAQVAAAGLAAAALAAAAPAAAPAKTIVQIGGTVGPAIIPFTTTPHALSLLFDVRLSTDVPDGDPATIVKTTIFFPHGPRVNGALFPSCDPKVLKRRRGSRRACPRGSRLGGGTAIGTSPQFHGIRENLKVDVYNGPGGRTLLFWLHGDIPVSIASMIVASLQPIHSHMWAYRLTLKVPKDLQELIPGTFASLLRFTTKVGGTVQVREHGRLVRRGYIEALACPPGALVPVRSIFSFIDHPTVTSDGYVTCR
jgi:hypothetical protein